MIITERKKQKYGGDLIIANLECCLSDCVGWDIHEASYVSATWWLNPVQECLIQADFLQKGPRGTKENQFNMFRAELTEDLLCGWLISSWSWSDEPMGVTLKIRKGVKWQPNSTLGMDSREFTPDDVAFWINTYRRSPKKGYKMELFTDLEPAVRKGDDSVFVHFTRPFASWAWVFGYSLYSNVYPMEQKLVKDFSWHKVTGTGPFRLINYRDGVGAEYAANPNYWKKINLDGEDYRIPFADRLIQPIFENAEKAVESLKRGEIDIISAVPIRFKNELEQLCPELNITECPSGAAITAAFNFRSGPCASMSFRRALIMGTDNEYIASQVEGAKIGGFPFSRALGKHAYTDIDEMPEDVAVLFGCDREMARKEIELSGYGGAPVYIHYTDDNENIVLAAKLLCEEWKRLGVNAQLSYLDVKTLTSFWTGDGTGWEGVIVYHGTNSKMARGIENERIKGYLSCSADKAFNRCMDEMMAETDPARREYLMKEAAVRYISRVDEFGLFEMNTLTCWWPWVKNYYGETESGNSGNLGIISACCFIDKEMKDELLETIKKRH